ncbi:unnamed protein product [Phyllotreta striolata]|uniref:Uncharacterized protein n=1 Tax=Phyllotreta striolata TaxID=444603 RepID=A0A9N9XI63_PHYSR|nr:unnamed protein product [Phyllotreta striolata]
MVEFLDNTNLEMDSKSRINKILHLKCPIIRLIRHQMKQVDNKVEETMLKLRRRNSFSQSDKIQTKQKRNSVFLEVSSMLSQTTPPSISANSRDTPVANLERFLPANDGDNSFLSGAFANDTINYLPSKETNGSDRSEVSEKGGKCQDPDVM